MSTIKWETADHMMNVLAFAFAVSATRANIPVDMDEALEFAQEMFKKYCEAYGITDVEMEEDE